jgi:hypothetical protein
MSKTVAYELYLSEKQRFASLLYLAGRIPAARLLAILDGAPEMCLLRLTEGETAPSQT